MATQNNHNHNYDDNDTNDCPICLCPLSTPWGICTPCGHAYCRGCWDQLAAASYNNQQRSRGNNDNKPSCAVCKTVCKEFVTVFVDLNVASSNVAPAAASREGTTVAAHDMSTLQQLDNDINDENDDEEKLDQLTKEWDSLWRELEMLHPEIIPSDSSSNGDENNDEEGENNSLIWDNGQREVAAICANFIDLTQDNTHDNDDDNNNNDGASQVPIPSRKTSRKQQKEKAAPSLQGQEALQQKEQRTHTILRRLKQLHREIMQFQHDNIARQSSSSSSPSSSFTNMTTQQTQKLRSKLIKLQSSNADLTSQLQSHQLEIDTLNTRIDSYQKSLTERTVETEKEKRKAETIAQEFHLMEQSYEKHMSKTSLEHNALKSDIRRLQDEVTKLTSQSGLQDLQEMEEIRRKYSKMSQDVHLLRSENARLTKRLEDEERMRAASKTKFNKMMTEMMNKSDVADGGKDSVVAHSSSSRHDKSIKSRKVSLDGRGRDQQAFPPKKMPSVAAAAAATTTFSSSQFKKMRPPSPKCKDNPPKKSKAMDILDNTRSRKHSLQQNSLLMSVKRTKTTSFAKEKAPRKSNVSSEVETSASSSGIPHPFFGRKRSEDRS